MFGMNFLEKVIDEGRFALPISQHGAFLDTLRHSLTVDPMIYTPASFDEYGFSQRTLYDLKVLLLRPLAYGFLQETGAAISKSAFDKRTTVEAYERRFERAPWLISVKPRIMLLTYTEWMHLVLPEPLPIQLPKDLRD